MNKGAHIGEVTHLLVCAARGRAFTNHKAWDYGWSVQDYRRSLQAAITHDSERNVGLSLEAIGALEAATEILLRVPQIRELYDQKEFWSLIVSLIGTLPMDATPEHLTTLVEERLAQVTQPGDAVVAFPIANLDPGDEPIEAGPLVIGRWGKAWLDHIQRRTGRREFLSLPIRPWWAPLLLLEKKSPGTRVQSSSYTQVGSS